MLLLLSSDETAHTVQEVADQLFIDVVRCQTRDEMLAAWRSSKSEIVAVVAALGADASTYLFDKQHGSTAADNTAFRTRSNPSSSDRPFRTRSNPTSSSTTTTSPTTTASPFTTTTSSFRQSKSAPTSTLITAVTSYSKRRSSGGGGGGWIKGCVRGGGSNKNPLMIVYSHTACRNQSTRKFCISAGADEVLCSKAKLKEAIVATVEGTFIGAGSGARVDGGVVAAAAAVRGVHRSTLGTISEVPTAATTRRTRRAAARTTASFRTKSTNNIQNTVSGFFLGGIREEASNETEEVAAATASAAATAATATPVRSSSQRPPPLPPRNHPSPLLLSETDFESIKSPGYVPTPTKVPPSPLSAVTESANQESPSSSVAARAMARKGSRAASKYEQNHTQKRQKHSATASAGCSYGPVQRRAARDALLAAKSGQKSNKHGMVVEPSQVVESMEATAKLAAQAATVPYGIEPGTSAGNGASNGGTICADPKTVVRIVHVSDTHAKHSKVFLPPGDLLLHTGDFVGNYGPKHDVGTQFATTLAWLSEASFKYKRVMLIAGNHDTFLDARCYNDAMSVSARAQLATFLKAHKNVDYLENSGAEYLGLRVWGSPQCISRVESAGNRYYSDAFERTARERKVTWTYDYPKGNVDILMTHAPPHGYLSSGGTGCEEMAKGVYGIGNGNAKMNASVSQIEQAASTPMLHVFGHDHGGFGLHWEPVFQTCFMNSAQEKHIELDEGGGGTALTYDVNVPLA